MTIQNIIPWTVAVLGFLLIAGLITLKSIELPYGEWYGQIGDRQGRVVSHNIGDLRITLNVSATEDEADAQYEKYMNDRRWKGYEVQARYNSDNMRVWITDWRWNVILWGEDY